MRSPKLPVLLGAATIWLGGVGALLDLVGRWDAAMHIKTLLPSVLPSPFLSPIILVIGFVVLYWNTKKTMIVAAVFDAHGNAYEKPSHPVIKYGLYAVLTAFICVAVFVAVWNYMNPPKISLAPKPEPTIGNPALPPNTKIPNKIGTFRRKGDTPCTSKVGKSYPDYSLIPGGPNLQRPMLVLNTGTFPFAAVDVKGTNLLLFEVVITNRGSEHRQKLGALRGA